MNIGPAQNNVHAGQTPSSGEAAETVISQALANRCRDLVRVVSEFFYVPFGYEDDTGFHYGAKPPTADWARE